MSNWDVHKISVVGPPKEIARFVKDRKIVSGAIDMVTGKVLDGWKEKPWMNLGGGRHIIEKCVAGPCHVEIEFESVGFLWPDVMYRNLAREYPTLKFQWSYGLDMDNGIGYVDETGDHCYREDHNYEYVAVEPVMKSGYPTTESDPVSEDLTCDSTVEDEAFLRELAQMDAEGNGEAGVASVMVNHAGETESNDNEEQGERHEND
jgi:hypothetical protein